MAKDVVRLENIHKRFGSVTAVEDVSLTIREGEFFSLLGPSGSGKTTLLRIIAGLEVPTSGRVFIDGEDVTQVPAWKRSTSLVFQDFGLFPHMTVLQNVEFPLKARKVPPAERRRQALEMLSLVHLAGYESRYPSQLSGGQKQRVALARGLVAKPKILLLDEPLANLDRKLRDVMEVELRRLQRELGITFTYVTHNQEEALTLSDRVAVINEGRLEQLSPTLEVYEKPRTAFVASFVGKSNTLTGVVGDVEGDVAWCRMNGDGRIAVRADGWAPGSHVVIYVKTERVRIDRELDGLENVLPARIQDRILRGAFVDYVVTVDGREWIVTETLGSGPRLDVGEQVHIGWGIDDQHAFVTPVSP